MHLVGRSARTAEPSYANRRVERSQTSQGRDTNGAPWVIRTPDRGLTWKTRRPSTSPPCPPDRERRPNAPASDGLCPRRTSRSPSRSRPRSGTRSAQGTWCCRRAASVFLRYCPSASRVCVPGILKAFRDADASSTARRVKPVGFPYKSAWQVLHR